MKTKQDSQNKKWWKVFLGISAATIVAAGVGVGIGCAIWHKNPKTSFNVSCTNPNLTFNNADTLSLTWTSANYTPTTITLKDGDSNDKWNLTGGDPVTPTLTLSRQSQNLTIGTYPVTLVASDGTNNKEATISVTVNVIIPNSNQYIGIKENGDIITGQITATLDLDSLSLKYLYIPPNSVVQTLDCGSNKLQQLDISNNSQLTTLYCESNELLQQLDVSGCTNLTTLDCYYNQLTSLDVSGYTNLTTLKCSSNQLQQLDVSGCTNLTTLDCFNNQLQSLDVSGCTNLQEFYCNNNPLSLIKLPTNKSTGSFTFASSSIEQWTASGYATNGVIWCNSKLTINNKPSSWNKIDY